MRTHLTHLIPCVSLVSAMIACSGSTTYEGLDTDTDAPKKSPPFDREGTGPSGSSDSETTTPAAKTKAAAGDTKDESPPETPKCTLELEPNDEDRDANTFETYITGELSSWVDGDKLRVVAPSGVGAMIVEHAEGNGKINYKITREGDPESDFNVSFTAKAPRVRVIPGRAYIFGLKAPDGTPDGNVVQPKTYEVRVSFAKE